MIGHVDGVSVEFDKTDRKRATGEAHEPTVAFLGNYGLVDAEQRRSDPTVYRVYDERYGFRSAPEGRLSE